MEENEKEVIDTVEETQEVNEVEETIADDAPSLEDYDALKKKAATLEAQKEHWRKKAELTAETKKDNSPVSLSDEQRQEVALIARGVPESVIQEAFVVAKAKGLSLNDAMKDPLIDSYYKNVKEAERKEKAQLGASGKAGVYKGVDLVNAVGMTEEEHRKAIGM